MELQEDAGRGQRSPPEQEEKPGSASRIPHSHPTGCVADVGKKILDLIFPDTQVPTQQVLPKQDCRKECRMNSAYFFPGFKGKHLVSGRSCLMH